MSQRNDYHKDRKRIGPLRSGRHRDTHWPIRGVPVELQSAEPDRIDIRHGPSAVDAARASPSRSDR